MSSRTARAVATLGPGDMFGEIGLLLTGRRTAAVIADSPMLVLALFEQTYRRLSKQHPEFADVVRTQCGGRFTRSTAV